MREYRIGTNLSANRQKSVVRDTNALTVRKEAKTKSLLEIPRQD